MTAPGFLDEIRATLATWFATEWIAETGQGSESGAVRIVWPGDADAPNADEELVRFSFRPSLSQRVLMTGSRSSGIRQSGLVVVSVFVPLDLGDGRLTQLAGLAQSILTERRLTTEGGVSVYLSTATVTDLGAVGTMFRAQVSASFEATEF